MMFILLFIILSIIRYSVCKNDNGFDIRSSIMNGMCLSKLNYLITDEKFNKLLRFEKSKRHKSYKKA